MKTLLLRVGLVGGMMLGIVSFSFGQTFSYSPNIDENNVSLNPILAVSFDSNVTLGQEKNFFIVKDDFSRTFTLYTGKTMPPGMPPSPKDDRLIPDGNTLYIDFSETTLEPNSNYIVYADEGAILVDGVAWDVLWNDYPYWTFTTTSGTPSWTSTYPLMTNQTTSTIDLDIQMDQEGDYYYVVTGEFFQNITEDQIASGQDGNGNPVAVANSGSGPLPFGSVTSTTLNFTKGSTWSNPFLYIVGKSDNGEYTEIELLPLDLTPPMLETFTPVNGSTNIEINSPIVLNFTEKLFAYNSTDTEIVALTKENASTYFSINDGNTVPFTATFSNNDATITLSPTRNLEGNTTCTISFPKVFLDEHENQQGSVTGAFSFTTEAVNIWNGSVNNSWGPDDQSGNWVNWENGTYNSGNSTVIPADATNFPEITTNDLITVNNLYIEPGASLTQYDGTLTVNGTFTLQSSADVNASYLPIGGALSATNVKIEQHISDPDRFYFVSPPVDGATKETMGVSGNIRYFDNSTSSYLTVDNTTTLETGRGYYFKNSKSVVFSGTINRGEQQISVQRSDAGLGWNLVGNPLPTSIDWTQIEFDPLTSVENSFWIWLNDREPGVYGTYNGNTEVGTVIPIENGGIIPSNHAFWVKVPIDQSEGQITIPTSAMQGNAFSYLKSSSTGTKYPSLKMTSDFNGNIDELAIALAPEATGGIDNYDTQKMLSHNSNFIEIYTLVENQSLAINGLPASSEPIEIPVGYSAKNTGTCEFSISLNTLGNDATVTIRENMAAGNDVYSELTNDGIFSFQVNSTGRNNDRFTLIINTSSVVTDLYDEKEPKQEEFCSFKSNENEIIAYITTPNKTSYQLFDINGKLLDQGSIHQGSNNIQVSQKGTVILQVKNEGGKTASYKTAF